MGTQAIAWQGSRRGRGRPRVIINPAVVRRLRDQGRTLDEIAQQMCCGRGTVARALEKTSGPRAAAATAAPIAARAAELARSRTDPPGADAALRERLRENARHLAYRRIGDGMRMECGWRASRFCPPIHPSLAAAAPAGRACCS